MRRSILLFLLIPALINASCSHQAAPAGSKDPVPAGTKCQPGPSCIVYKTKADYSRQVPVLLAGDHQTIVSFPAVSDIGTNGEHPYPGQLNMGYLLDNRGINADVAFLDYSYESYANLKQTPSLEELMNHLLVSDPLLEMYRCGNKSSYNDVTAAMNEKIRTGFKDCNKLK